MPPSSSLSSSCHCLTLLGNSPVFASACVWSNYLITLCFSLFPCPSVFCFLTSPYKKHFVKKQKQAQIKWSLPKWQPNLATTSNGVLPKLQQTGFSVSLYVLGLSSIHVPFGKHLGFLWFGILVAAFVEDPFPFLFLLHVCLSAVCVSLCLCVLILSLCLFQVCDIAKYPFCVLTLC